MFGKTHTGHNATTSGILDPGVGGKRRPNPGHGYRLLETGESVHMSDQYHDNLAVPPEWRPVPVDLLGMRFVVGRYPPCRRPAGVRGQPGRTEPQNH